MKAYTYSTHLIIISLMAGVLPGCGFSGDWPNLSDKIPEASERVRKVERTAITVQPPASELPVMDKDTAAARIADIRKDVIAAERAYRTALSDYKALSLDDPALRQNLWFEAQLSLTRYSQTVSKLDDIIYSEPLSGTPTASEAAKIKAEYTRVIINERRALEQIKPENIA